LKASKYIEAAARFTGHCNQNLQNPFEINVSVYILEIKLKMSGYFTRYDLSGVSAQR
jgi:hypothetical protein